jgi:hypothetical protein
MRWFQKHLNLTLFIITICSNIISFSLVNLYINIAHINQAGPKYPLHAKVMYNAITSFRLDASLLLADVLIIAGSCWFLAQKKRSFTFLVPFVTFFIFDIPILLSYVIRVSPVVTNVFGYPRQISILLWIIGWIILMKLKDKSTPLAVPPLDRNHSSFLPPNTKLTL